MAKQSTNMNPLAFIRKYDELFNRLLFLLGALVVYRFGSHVPIPGMNPDSLANFFKTNDHQVGRPTHHSLRRQFAIEQRG